mmetsp:Transcript_49819/g.128522  ORF Transcript_49819/g.128522 Transcript_49819/m.128522 type:complete len:203 (+) Transcript_49819:807-1415(+)
MQIDGGDSAGIAASCSAAGCCDACCIMWLGACQGIVIVTWLGHATGGGGECCRTRGGDGCLVGEACRTGDVCRGCDSTTDTCTGTGRCERCAHAGTAGCDAAQRAVGGGDGGRSCAGDAGRTQEGESGLAARSGDACIATSLREGDICRCGDTWRSPFAGNGCGTRRATRSGDVWRTSCAGCGGATMEPWRDTACIPSGGGG